MNKTYWFIICLAALFICSPELRAAEDPSPAKLMGTLNWDGQRMAFIKLKRWPLSVFLRIGEIKDDVELLAADEQTAKVKLSKAGEEILLAFDSADPAGEEIKQATDNSMDKQLTNHISFRLQSMDQEGIFKIYQKVAKRSLLRGGLRGNKDPNFHFDLHSKGLVPAEALLRAIEAGMVKQGIMLQPHLEKYAVAGSQQDILKLTPELLTNSMELSKLHFIPLDKSEEELIPSGAIHLENAQLNTVLAFYSELCNRTLLFVNLPAANMTFNSETALTPKEVIYALCALLALHDLSAMPIGEKFVFIYPTSQSKQMANLLSQTWPVHFVKGREENRSLPNSVSPSNDPTLQQEAIKLNNAPLGQALKFYMDLAGQPVSYPTNSTARITLRSSIPLTRSQALLGIEMELDWQGLKMIQDKEGALRLIRAPDVR